MSRIRPAWRKKESYKVDEKKTDTGIEYKLYVPNFNQTDSHGNSMTTKFKDVFDDIKKNPAIQNNPDIKKDEDGIPILGDEQWVELLTSTFKNIERTWSSAGYNTKHGCSDKVWIYNIIYDGTKNYPMYIAICPKKTQGNVKKGRKVKPPAAGDDKPKKPKPSTDMKDGLTINGPKIIDAREANKHRQSEFDDIRRKMSGVIDKRPPAAGDDPKNHDLKDATNDIIFDADDITIGEDLGSITQTIYTRDKDGLTYHYRTEQDGEDDNHYKIEDENGDLVNERGKLINKDGSLIKTIKKSDYDKRQTKKRKYRPIAEEIINSGNDLPGGKWLDDYDTSPEPSEGYLTESDETNNQQWHPPQSGGKKKKRLTKKKRNSKKNNFIKKKNKSYKRKKGTTRRRK